MSTPFLTLRFALVYARRTATRAYALNGAALVASFAVFRLGANTALLVAIARAWRVLGVERGMIGTHRTDAVICGALSALDAAVLELVARRGRPAAARRSLERSQDGRCLGIDVTRRAESIGEGMEF